MPSLVFEIGTEEMPAVALPGAIQQMESGLAARLSAARLSFGTLRAVGTPRRLVAMVKGLAGRQTDLERKVRGPSRAVAFDADGRPTGAAIGFARKQGVSVESLLTEQTPQGAYVVASVIETGKPAEEALGPILQDLLRSLSFPKIMRWGDRATRFVRPVRWMLCLLDDVIVPVEFAGIQSGRTTRGHRYFAGDEIIVPHAESYESLLRQGLVMVDPEERRTTITAQGERLAASVGGRVPWDADLMEENVHLVEWPTCLLGHFDARFLELPGPVLVTAMKKHQRFFPVEDSQGKLLPYFISVRNGGEDHLEKVRTGNEAVLTARFQDARLFFDHDRVVPLQTMAERLGRLLFQEKLGTMAHKRDRLTALAVLLAQRWGLNETDTDLARRAAFLCKADLTSEMVIELPSLQGIMGREYALLQGEPSAVAESIAEHYKPRNAQDSLPVSRLGRLLAVADRMDTLVGYAGLGITPSGSTDPFGLRRAAQGLVQILAEEPCAPSVAVMEMLASDAYQQVNGLGLPLEALFDALQPLFEQRLEAYLEDRGIRYDLREAALGGGFVPGTVVRSVVVRAGVLQGVADDSTFVPTVQAAARVANILGTPDRLPPPGREYADGGREEAIARTRASLETMAQLVRADAFREPAEHALYDTARRVLPELVRQAGDLDYGSVYQTVQTLNDPVNKFFDDVLVMTEDAVLRENRLALLRLVDRLYRILADFRKVVVA